MKQLLLTLMTLALAGTAMADSYLYLDDFEVIPGQRITVPVKANFDGRVSGFQLDLTYPQGLTPVSIREGGDMAITYLESDGSEQTQSPAFYPNQAHDCCIAIFTNAGFWDPDGDGMYEQYGVIKWEAGAYDEMMLLTLNVDEGFTGDEIMLETELSSGSDTRGGTVTDLGQAGQLYSYVCHVTVKPEVTAQPVINVQEGDEAYTIMAVGDGVVTLYINGEVVDNPYMVYRTEEEQMLEVAATAQEDGKLISEVVTVTVVVPPVVVDPDPVEPADYALTLADAEVLHGNNVVIPVSMTNAEPITAFQTDLYLPEGFELLDAVPAERMAADHILSKNKMADGGVRILCYSLSISPFTGNEGELFYITVSVPDDAAGDYTLMLKKSILTTAGENAEVRCEDASSNLNVWAYVIGDANGDGVVTVSDVVAVANNILGKNPQPFIFDAADVNGDGEITVTDVVLIARIVLNPTLEDLNQLRAPAVAAVNDAMSGEGITIAAGETRKVTIALDNAMTYTAFQLDMQLPDGLTASNFGLTSRAGSHALDANVLEDGTQRVMCYSPMLATIDGNEGALLTFEVTAMGDVNGNIMVDGIEMVNAACQTVNLDGFAMSVNSGTTSVKETVAGVRIYAEGHDIIIESPVAQRVVISDVAGHAYSVDVVEGRTVIPARNSGVVVVKAGEKTAKLMIK
jgi:hypothetical protein